MDEQTIIPRDDAGKVYIQNNTMVWEVDSKSMLEINIPAICIIGEYTTMHAVFRNDWFIVFVLNAEETFQISAYANGMQEVLQQLSQLLKAEIKPKLGSATNFKSNVVWPAEISGQQLYRLQVIESKTWFDRFRARLGFGDPVELVFSDSVKESLV